MMSKTCAKSAAQVKRARAINFGDVCLVCGWRAGELSGVVVYATVGYSNVQNGVVVRYELSAKMVWVWWGVDFVESDWGEGSGPSVL